MLTTTQKELFKETFRQMFPQEQAEIESLMFDFGYAIGTHDDKAVNEAASSLISKGVSKELITTLIENLYKI